MRVAGPESADIMFGRIHESLFAHDSRDWTIEQHSTAYSDAIAAAVRVWAGRSGAAKKVKEVADFDELMLNFEHFDGGSCADNLFTPKRVPRPLACAKKTAKPAKSGRNLQPNPAPCGTPSCSSLGSVRSGTSSPSASPTRGRTRPALSSVDSTSSFGSGNQVKGAPNLSTPRARLDSSPCARYMLSVCIVDLIIVAKSKSLKQRAMWKTIVCFLEICGNECSVATILKRRPKPKPINCELCATVCHSFCLIGGWQGGQILGTFEPANSWRENQRTFFHTPVNDHG